MNKKLQITLLLSLVVLLTSFTSKTKENKRRTSETIASTISYIELDKMIHVREGDENHFINNSLVYEITPQEIVDKRAEFNIETRLIEMSRNGLGNYILGGGASNNKHIAKFGKNDIEVSIYEVLDYLQNPRATKYRSSSYFKGVRGGNMHEYGAFGDVMWFKKGSNNSLIGHLEFGDNNKETYVRLYYRFELVQ